MNYKSITQFFCALIFLLGLAGGFALMFTKVDIGTTYVIMDYSTLNIFLGWSIIIVNSFIACLGMLFVQHLENQEEQIFFLNVLVDKQDIIENNTKEEEVCEN